MTETEPKTKSAFRNLALPFVAVSQPALKGLMSFEEWLETPPVWRLWTLALSTMNNGGHAVFDTTELLFQLGKGGINRDTGEIVPIVAITDRSLRTLGKRLMDGGYAADVKSSRGETCVLVNAAVAQKSVRVGGSFKCSVHRSWKRDYTYPAYAVEVDDAA